MSESEALRLARERVALSRHGRFGIVARALIIHHEALEASKKALQGALQLASIGWSARTEAELKTGKEKFYTDRRRQIEADIAEAVRLTEAIK